MKAKIVSFVIAVSLISGMCAATSTSATAATETDQERIDSLMQQNLVLTEMIAKLKAESERTKTREEIFSACMQAAKGSSAMAAESIGGHCDQLLKK